MCKPSAVPTTYSHHSQMCFNQNFSFVFTFHSNKKTSLVSSLHLTTQAKRERERERKAVQTVKCLRVSLNEIKEFQMNYRTSPNSEEKCHHFLFLFFFSSGQRRSNIGHCPSPAMLGLKEPIWLKIS